MSNRPIESPLTPAGAEPNRGFTLLELLVVIIIISIMFSFATLAIRGRSPQELIQEEASRLDRLLTLALEEAVLRNTEYGLEFSNHGYRFLYFAEAEALWLPMETDRLLRPRQLPAEMEIELSVEQTSIVVEEDSESDEKKIEPQVFILSSEEFSPEFSALFSIPGIETSYIVEGYVDGQHRVKLSEL